ncbi:hypothetical protein BH11MYX2_BH11MYX2_33290 [soil metagenome]
MRSLGLLFVVLAVCSPRSEHVAPQAAPEPVEHAPDPMGPLFDRVLPGGAKDAPLIGPGGSLYVGARRWSSDGRFLGRQPWAIDGQVRPLAVAGTVDRPLLVAIGWGGMENMPPSPAHPGDPDRSWLLVAAPNEAKPMAATLVDRDFYADGVVVSPNGTAIAEAEGDAIVVRALSTIAVIGRAAIAPHDGTPVACWVDDARIAWTEVDADSARLRTLTIATNVVTVARLAAAAPLVCDPGGGAAAMVLADRVALIDLATATTLATTAIAPSDAEAVVVAVGQRGARLAIATRHGLALYHREGTTLTSLYTHALPRTAPARMTFTPDGTHLALATTGLTVFGPPAEARHAIAPRIAFDLPEGFSSRPAATDGTYPPWGWAQLAVPPGMTAGSAVLVDATARDQFADVTAIAIPRDELAGVPALDPTDEQIAAFAKTAMPQLFDQWANAEIGTDRDAEFTLRVGRTKGMPWFETREVWRDGCEPYDGYTRVVVDRDAVFVVRALVPPAGSTKGWLEKFFDLPFGNRIQIARRRGPDTGPC